MTEKTINEQFTDLTTRIGSIKAELNSISETIGTATAPDPSSSSDFGLKGLARFQYGIIIFETAIISALLIALFQRGDGLPLDITFGGLDAKSLFVHILTFIVLSVVAMTAIAGFTQIFYGSLQADSSSGRKWRGAAIVGTLVTAGIGALAALPFVLELTSFTCNSQYIGRLC